MPSRIEPSMRSRLTSEAFGTFLLTFTVFSNVLGRTHPAFAALSIAAVLLVLIYSLGDVSGSHLNPAVSIAISLAQQQRWITTLFYITVQTLGAILAGFCAMSIYGSDTGDASIDISPPKGVSYLQAGFGEALYTCLLCFIVLNTACSRANAGNQYFGLAIGFVIIAGGYALGGICSVPGLNPAVTLALDVTAGKLHWSLAYVGFQLLGAAFASLLYRFVRPEDFGSERVGSFHFERLLSEFIGTYFLVVTVGSNVLGGSFSVALSAAACLMSLIYGLGSVSGSHYNPAVTLAILLSGRKKLNTKEAMQYIVVQLFAGFLAGITYSSLYGGKSFPLSGGSIVPKNSPSFSWSAIAFVEIFYTFLLCFTVLSVATTRAGGKDVFGLAIALTVLAGGTAASSLGGGVMNPAVSVGIASSNAIYNNNGSSGSGSDNGNNVNTKSGNLVPAIIYSAYQLGGAWVSSVVFQITFASEYVKRAPKY